jgi:hypothetical protein
MNQITDLFTANRRIEKLEQLLKVAGCPNNDCGGQGWYVDYQCYSNPEGEQVQCQWCCERKEILNES